MCKPENILLIEKEMNIQLSEVSTVDKILQFEDRNLFLIENGNVIALNIFCSPAVINPEFLSNFPELEYLIFFGISFSNLPCFYY